MTPSEIRDLIVRRTGLPQREVAHVLHVHETILAECILREEDSYIGGILKLSSTTRRRSILRADGDREVIEQLAVTVKPRSRFRKIMNHSRST